MLKPLVNFEVERLLLIIIKNEQGKIAWSTIFLHLSDNIIREVKKTKAAVEIWTKLESLYKT